tara:strand:+ start:1795 stop:2628 length:834 start_codon:yes stop_codon:yes gene_type:complete
MEYSEIDIRLNKLEPYAEILIAKLDEINFESYSEDEYGVKGYVQTQKLDLDALEEIISTVAEHTPVSYKVKKLKQQNWNARWESSYSPVFINDDCVIRAHFHKSFPKIKYDLIITPKMSFGTGHHQTTLLMMNEMFNLDFNDKSVLDIGTGTGVLAILASKLGATSLLAIDIEEWAFNNSKENSKLNKVSNIDFIHGDARNIKNTKFDFILANINRNVILHDIEIYVNCIKDTGNILLSGFLKEDITLILDRTKAFNLELVDLKNIDKWQMLRLKKV